MASTRSDGKPDENQSRPSMLMVGLSADPASSSEEQLDFLVSSAFRRAFESAKARESSEIAIRGDAEHQLWR
jgi:hypothetical protein